MIPLNMAQSFYNDVSKSSIAKDKNELDVISNTFET